MVKNSDPRRSLISIDRAFIAQPATIGNSNIIEKYSRSNFYGFGSGGYTNYLIYNILLSKDHQEKTKWLSIEKFMNRPHTIVWHKLKKKLQDKSLKLLRCAAWKVEAQLQCTYFISCLSKTNKRIICPCIILLYFKSVISYTNTIYKSCM